MDQLMGSRIQKSEKPLHYNNQGLKWAGTLFRAWKFKRGAFWLQSYWISQTKPTFLGQQPLLLIVIR